MAKKTSSLRRVTPDWKPAPPPPEEPYEPKPRIVKPPPPTPPRRDEDDDDDEGPGSRKWKEAGEAAATADAEFMRTFKREPGWKPGSDPLDGVSPRWYEGYK